MEDFGESDGERWQGGRENERLSREGRDTEKRRPSDMRQAAKGSQ